MMDQIGSLLLSVVSGGATGLVGVLIQRWFDFKAKQQEIDIVKLNHANSIALAGIESAKAQKVAEVRANADVDMADSDMQARQAEADSRSLVASFEHDKAGYLDPAAQRRQGWVGATVTMLMGLVDFARGILRPGMTIYLCGVTTWMLMWAQSLVERANVALTAADVAPILLQIVSTILYVFTTAALWWFGTRPPKRQGDA